MKGFLFFGCGLYFGMATQAGLVALGMWSGALAQVTAAQQATTALVLGLLGISSLTLARSVRTPRP